MTTRHRRIRSFGLGSLLLAAGAFVAGHATSGQAVGQEAPEMDADVQAMMEMMEMMAELGSPGPAHAEVLNRFEGRWVGAFTWSPGPGADPMRMQGTIERRWILGGRYLEETMTGTSPWGPFEGRGILGHDNQTGEFHMTWFDSMNTGAYQERGTFDRERMLMTMWSTRTDPVTGHVIRLRNEIDLSDPDRHVARGWETRSDGTSHRTFEGVFERAED